MNIIKFVLGSIQSNCYLLYHKDQAFIIDYGFESEDVLSFLESHHLSLQGIYITHGHFDHWGGVNSLKKAYPNALIYAPIKDQLFFEKGPLNLLDDTLIADVYVKSHDKIFILDMPFEVYETPGHSPGGTILHGEDILFTGDTLFYQGVGRTDLPYADSSALIASILMMYDHFSDDTICYPGHGRATTIGFEKLHNPFVKKEKK